MGFINERKNILRAEDGPLIAVDKNGNEVQIGNGSISCDAFKCNEQVLLPFVEPNDMFNAIEEDDASFFTQSMIDVGNQLEGTINGFLKSISSSIEDVTFENVAYDGLVTPPVEQAGGSSFPCQYIVNRQDQGDPLIYKEDQLGLNVQLFKLQYAYTFNDATPEPGATATFFYSHTLIVQDFADVPVYLNVEVQTEGSPEVIIGFTYSVQIPQLVSEI